MATDLTFTEGKTESGVAALARRLGAAFRAPSRGRVAAARPGPVVPDFTLPLADGAMIDSALLRRDGPLLLLFDGVEIGEPRAAATALLDALARPLRACVAAAIVITPREAALRPATETALRRGVRTRGPVAGLAAALGLEDFADGASACAARASGGGALTPAVAAGLSAFVIDCDGTLLWSHRGPAALPWLRDQIAQALSQTTERRLAMAAAHAL